eukprot:COSAG06_NODE_3918_length_4769_cov_2.014133_5_plen_345_part_00
MWCTTKWVTYKNEHNEWRANCSGTMHTSELVCEITAGCASAPPPPPSPSPSPPSPTPPTPPPAQPAVGPLPHPPPVENSHCGDSWVDCTMVVLSVAVLAAVAAACCWARCRRNPRRQAPGKDDLEKCLCDYPVGGEAAVPVVMAETVQEHPREQPLYASTAAQPHPSALCASTGLTFDGTGAAALPTCGTDASATSAPASAETMAPLPAPVAAGFSSGGATAEQEQAMLNAHLSFANVADAARYSGIPYTREGAAAPTCLQPQRGQHQQPHQQPLRRCRSDEQPGKAPPSTTARPSSTVAAGFSVGAAAAPTATATDPTADCSFGGAAAGTTSIRATPPLTGDE